MMQIAFYGTVLTKNNGPLGASVDTVNKVLGFAVGKSAARHFQPEAKQRMKMLVENLRKAFYESLTSLTWMSPETRTEALDKSHSDPKLATHRWRDYSALVIEPKRLFENLLRASQFEMTGTSQTWRSSR